MENMNISIKGAIEAKKDDPTLKIGDVIKEEVERNLLKNQQTLK